MTHERKLRAVAAAVLTAAFLVTAPALAEEHETEEEEAAQEEAFCPSSQGGYKNSDAWPVDNVSLGAHNYAEEELRAVLDAPTRGDKSIALARQLIAAELNAAAGHATNVTTADENRTVDEAVAEAHALIGDQEIPAKVKGKADEAWGALTAELDAFNNGHFTPGCEPEPEPEEEEAPAEGEEGAEEEETDETEAA